MYTSKQGKKMKGGALSAIWRRRFFKLHPLKLNLSSFIFDPKKPAGAKFFLPPSCKYEIWQPDSCMAPGTPILGFLTLYRSRLF
jgi:hypothetical protein